MEERKRRRRCCFDWRGRVNSLVPLNYLVDCVAASDPNQSSSVRWRDIRSEWTFIHHLNTGSPEFTSLLSPRCRSFSLLFYFPSTPSPLSFPCHYIYFLCLFPKGRKGEKCERAQRIPPFPLFFTQWCLSVQPTALKRWRRELLHADPSHLVDG